MAKSAEKKVKAAAKPASKKGTEKTTAKKPAAKKSVGKPTKYFVVRHWQEGGPDQIDAFDTMSAAFEYACDMYEEKVSENVLSELEQRAQSKDDGAGGGREVLFEFEIEDTDFDGNEVTDTAEIVRSNTYSIVSENRYLV